MQICADALTSESGARYGALLKPSLPRQDVEATYTLAYRAFGGTFHKRGTTFEARDLQQDNEFAVQWASIFDGFLAEGNGRWVG